MSYQWLDRGALVETFTGARAALFAEGVPGQTLP
jgi:hypothetical protein